MPYGIMREETRKVFANAGIVVTESDEPWALTLSVIFEGALDEEFGFDSSHHYEQVADVLFDHLLEETGQASPDFSVRITEPVGDTGDELYMRSTLEEQEQS